MVAASGVSFDKNPCLTATPPDFPNPVVVVGGGGGSSSTLVTIDTVTYSSTTTNVTPASSLKTLDGDGDYDYAVLDG